MTPPLDGDVTQFEQQQQTAPDLSLTALRDWLKTRDPNKKYSYIGLGRGCLLEQWHRAHGRTYVQGCAHGAVDWEKSTAAGHLVFWPHARFDDIAEVVAQAPLFTDYHSWTFGAALARCERAIADGWR